MSSTQIDGKPFDLSNLENKLVILHFWETWCFPEADIKELSRLSEKYSNEITIVGCNIEGPNSPEATQKFEDFLASHPEIKWVQLHEPGSVDNSPLAHQLGIATEPAVFLIDATGKLIESSVGISNLEREIERQLN